MVAFQAVKMLAPVFIGVEKDCEKIPVKVVTCGNSIINQVGIFAWKVYAAGSLDRNRGADFDGRGCCHFADVAVGQTLKMSMRLSAEVRQRRGACWAVAPKKYQPYADE
jgi:hypothetical protein